jgi:Chaperone of endosialidase
MVKRLKHRPGRKFKDASRTVFSRYLTSFHVFKGHTREQGMKNIKSFIVGGFVASSLGALAVNIPNTFSAGQPIKATDVNDNFGSLKAAVNALEAGTGLPVPLVLTGSRTNGLSGATLQTTNSNGGIATYISQAKTGTSDAALVVGQLGSGPILQGYGSNGGTDEFRVESNGTVILNKPDNTPNITLNNATRSLDFGSGLGQHLNLFGNTYGIGVQNRTMYYRIDDATGLEGGFAWYKGGTHNENIANPGGGMVLMKLERDGFLSVASGARFSADVSVNGPVIAQGFVQAFDDVSTNRDLIAVRDVRAGGNVYANGVLLTSDRNAKTNFSGVNARATLEKVVRLPISQWNYKSDASSLRHVGPMAQDFHAAFGLNGSDDTHISSVDTQGVALAAIQGLNQKLEADNAKLRASLADLEARLWKLEHR